MTRKQSRARRWRPRGRAWVWAVPAAGLTLSALRLRGRVAALTVLAAPADGPGPEGSADGGRYRLVAADGVHVPAVARAAAEAHAAAHGLALLELVPADLDAERALDMARLVDPATYRDDRLAPGRGAAQAVLVDTDLLARLDAREPDARLADADIAELVAEAKLFAPTGCDLAVVTGVSAGRETSDGRRALLHAVHGGGAPIAVAFPFVGLAGLAAGIVLAPGWAAAAAAAYCLQPWLVLRGGPLAAGVSPRAGLDRPTRSLRRALITAASAARPRATLVGERPPPADVTRKQDESARARYADALAHGLDRFFEARRSTCPWCGGTDLGLQVECTDVLQAKPGTFRLERCGGCGHVFQNPRLSQEGLDFYYGDFYDGVGADEVGAVFASSARPYEGRADLVRRHLPDGDPERWLDVGTGHAHFCLVARRTFPDTRFEGLDLGDTVETAARRGWIDEAHRGLLPDTAAALAGRFDVVSMHHYLEHTRDPAADLEAARTALRPGGHLLIEVPDPACLYGRLLGRWWGPWFQPQHQHLMPLDNLCERLDGIGFTVVATERHPAHQPVEMAMAAWLVLSRLGPKVGQPWQPPGTAAGTARRAAVFVAGAPLVAAGLLVDKLTGDLVARRPGGSNAFRILARRDDGAAGGALPAPPRAMSVAAPAPAPGASTGRSSDARAARRRRRAERAAVEDLAPAPHPDPRTWQDALLAGIAAHAGHEVAYARPPEPLAHTQGPWAFSADVAVHGAPPATALPGWAGPLTIRLADDRAAAEREAAALLACAAHGLGAPAVLGTVDLAAPDGPPRWALVTTRSADPVLPEIIGLHLDVSDDLLVGFAHHQADLHDCTAGLAPAAIPVIDPAAEVERLAPAGAAAGAADARWSAWLRAHTPAPAEGDRAVLCHGGYQPLCVQSPAADGWAAAGGPGRGLTATNWCAAVVAEREYDVAFTLVAFWSSPFFAASRPERTAIKMIRNTLATTYRQGYLARRPLDPQRLAFWQVFHARRGVARLDGTYPSAGSPFAVVDRGPLPAALRGQLERYAELVAED